MAYDLALNLGDTDKAGTKEGPVLKAATKSASFPSECSAVAKGVRNKVMDRLIVLWKFLSKNHFCIPSFPFCRGDSKGCDGKRRQSQGLTASVHVSVVHHMGG